MRVKFNLDTKLYFLIGDPMEHSCTALVNNRMFELVNENALCVPVTVKKGQLAEFIRAAKLLHAAGIYLTMPHKGDIIPFLDECEESARVFHSVNHVKIVDGRLIGIGLDGVGMGRTIEKAAGGGSLEKVLLIGAGAVAGPIAADLYRRGARDFKIANRTVQKAEALGKLLEEQFQDIRVECGGLEESFLCAAAADRDVAVQCTSLGLGGAGKDGAQDFQSLDFMDRLPGHCIAADVLYPKTSFLQRAWKNGLKTVDGMWMALNQQEEVMRFHFGADITERELLEAEEAFHVAVTMREVRARRWRGEM